MLDLRLAERVLAALGEASRLRLMLLCAAAEQGVGELAQALGQSEPRVSRHLKILAEAGLVGRRREGHRVLYRSAQAGDAAEIARVALARIDAGDATVRRDASRAAKQRLGATESALPGESRLGRALRELVAADAPVPVAGRCALLGLGHLELIEALCRLGARPLAVAPSSAAAAVARSWIDQRALDCDLVVGLLPAGPALQALLLDRAAGSSTALETVLAEARRFLAPGARLWLFERYDALEDGPARVVEHPLARLRRVLREAGYACDRIRPLEADGVHVLATTATANPGALRARSDAA